VGARYFYKYETYDIPISTFPTQDGVVRVGSTENAPEKLLGIIDEVRIYGRILTQSEIQQDMNDPIDKETDTSFTLANDITFSGITSIESQLWLNKSYTYKKRSAFRIQVNSPSEVAFNINTWFNTANSSAELRLISPLSTSINFSIYSPNFVSASVTGAVSYTYTSGSSGTLEIIANSDVSHTIVIYGTYTESTINEYTPENYAVEITDMEGCGNWVFSEEQYYTFQAQYWDGDGYADLDTMKIKFTDDIEDVIAVYNQPDEEWSLESGSEVVNLKAGTKTILDSNLLQVTFQIYFKNKISDALNVDLQMWCNDTSGEIDNWEVKEADYFNIYNLGGHSTLETSGNATRIAGGDFFDFEASAHYQETSSVAVNITYRNIQHVKMLPDFYVWYNVTIPPNPIIYLEYLVYYCVDDVWVEGWKLRLSAQEASGGSDVWWKFFVESYSGGSLVKNETIYLYMHNASLQSVGGRFWVDLWFNKENASSTFGGRVNAYYFPMTDSSNQWLRWLTGSNWGINEHLRKQSMVFGDLLDSENKICYASEINLVKIGSNLTVSCPAEDRYVYAKVSDYDVFDLTFASLQKPFEGVQTPVFDETKVAVMPQGGFLGAIVSALNQLGGWISNALGPALLGFWNSFVGFLDTVFAFTGNPTLFSDLMSWLSSLGTWLGTSFTWLISALTSVFTLLTAFLGKLLNTISTVVNQWVSVFQTFFGMLDGTYTTGVNLWNDLGLSTWVILVAILYPVYLIWIWDEKGIDGVLTHLKMVMDIAAWGITIFIRVIQLFLDLIGTIIERVG